jgi:hypothetical protein
MTRADTFSSFALAVSICSLGATIYFNLRDRPRVVAKSKFLPAWDGNPAKVNVSVVNAGRRPVILRMWAGAESQSNWVGTFLGERGKGLALAEYERHEFSLEKPDLMADTPDEDVPINDLWFEDTLERRYPVSDSAANLAKLWAT